MEETLADRSAKLEHLIAHYRMAAQVFRQLSAHHYSAEDRQFHAKEALKYDVRANELQEEFNAI